MDKVKEALKTYSYFYMIRRIDNELPPRSASRRAIDDTTLCFTFIPEEHDEFWKALNDLKKNEGTL